MAAQPLYWTVTAGAAPSAALVLLHGDLTDAVDFEHLSVPHPDVVLDCMGVRHVTTAGAHRLCAWIGARGLGAVAADRCRPGLVEHLNVSAELARHLSVRSAFTPLECPGCRATKEVLVRIPADRSCPTVPTPSCPTCHVQLRPAVPADAYFAFLTHTGPGESATCGLTWRLDCERDETVVYLEGEIDEHANLVRLGEVLRGRVALDLAGVRRLNSAGVRLWREWIGDLSAAVDLVLRRCSCAFVQQLSMVHAMAGAATVESFYMPYRCDDCGAERQILALRATMGRGLPEGSLPEADCDQCATPMMFDDVPDKYLAFLAEA